MDALGLVCESHRSTEAVTAQEMDLVRHFLLPNLNSQSACVRQQTVSLLKKVCRFLHGKRGQTLLDSGSKFLLTSAFYLNWLLKLSLGVN